MRILRPFAREAIGTGIRVQGCTGERNQHMMKAFTRRAITATVGGVAMVGLAAGPAAAHFCYKDWQTDQSAAGVGKSSGWMTFEDMAATYLGLCPEGIVILADAGGVTTDTLVNARGTLAGGTLKKGADAGTSTISYLDFAAMEAQFEAAFGACGLPVPDVEGEG